MRQPPADAKIVHVTSSGLEAAAIWTKTDVLQHIITFDKMTWLPCIC